jgi:hypothetical protein
LSSLRCRSCRFDFGNRILLSQDISTEFDHPRVCARRPNKSARFDCKRLTRAETGGKARGIRNPAHKCDLAPGSTNSDRVYSKVTKHTSKIFMLNVGRLCPAMGHLEWGLASNAILPDQSRSGHLGFVEGRTPEGAAPVGAISNK